MQCESSGTTFSAWDKPSGFPYGLCWSPVVDINEKLREAIDHSGPETLIAMRGDKGGVGLIWCGTVIGELSDFARCLNVAKRLDCRVIITTMAAMNFRRNGVDAWEFATPLDKLFRRHKLAVAVLACFKDTCPGQAMEYIAQKTAAADQATRKRKRGGE